MIGKKFWLSVKLSERRTIGRSFRRFLFCQRDPDATWMQLA
jgi:hypothetical protein